MSEYASPSTEQGQDHESRDDLPLRPPRRGAHDEGRERLSCERTERQIDQTLENSFPASDPPAWTSGVAAPVRPASQREDRTQQDTGAVPAAGEEARESQRSQQPPVYRTARHGDRLSPGRAFWDMSEEERQRAAVSPGRDDASTDLIGRRDASEGPHEALPGAPRPPSHREHAGARGDEALPLHRWTRDALYDQARGMNIKGRSRMTKAELIEAIRAAQQPQSK